MAQYTFIAPDGTRSVVKYNPRKDGVVSVRLSMVKKIKWLSLWCHRHPGDLAAKERLSCASRDLRDFDRQHKGKSSVSPQKERGATNRLSGNAGPQVIQRPPNSTSKVEKPLETESLLQPQQRPGLTKEECPPPGQRESAPIPIGS
jgi:hypothetical protein